MNHTFNPLNVLRGITSILLILTFSGCGEISEVPDAACRYPGKINCACLPDDSCYQSANGLQMLCQEDQCVEPVCADDDLQKGCLCADGQQCEGELICINGNCVDDTGQTREAPANPICYTPCRGGGVTMADGTFANCDSDGLLRGCLPGSTCVAGTCKAPEPLVAPQPASQQPGGPTACVSNGDCQSSERCVDGLCQVIGCLNDDGCDQGYVCDASECTKPANYCEVPDECPVFQACVANRCVSDCETTDDCNGARECVRKVCRLPCSADQSPPCAEGSCETVNNSTYCMPDGVPATGPEPIDSAVDLSDNSVFTERVLKFINDGLAYGPGREDSDAQGAVDMGFRGFNFAPRSVGGKFILYNQGNVERKFIISKKSHTEYNAEGPVIVEESPLHWVTLGVSAPVDTDTLNTDSASMDGTGADEPMGTAGDMDGAAEMRPEAPMLGRVPALEVTVGGGQQVVVYLGDIKNPLLSRWEGELKIEAQETKTSKVIPLSFTGSAEGHWVGQMHSFANFNDKNLLQWQGNPTRTNLQLVQNAFIRRWVAFKENRISLDEFKAMVNATVEGSWAFTSVKNRCPSAENPNPLVGCYLYDNPAGIAIYSDNLPSAPIPSGGVSLPIAMMVRASNDEAPGAWTGRVVTEGSLQYIGDPSINLTFTSNPNDCSDTRSGASCIKTLESFELNSVIGGRFTPGPGRRCVGSSGYAEYLTPWLVEGFTAGTTADQDGRVKSECRETRLPFTDPSAKDLNALVTQANPVPDGKPRIRKLEMIDGVMVDQKTMYVIYKETFPSIFSSGGADDGRGDFSSYGLVALSRQNTVVSDEDFEGNDQSVGRDGPAENIDYCPTGLVDGIELEDDPSLYALALIRGYAPTRDELDGANFIDFSDPNATEFVHYLCEDTGYFNAGRNDMGPVVDGADRDTDGYEACPAGSKVIYFSTIGHSYDDIADEPCQLDGSCLETLNGWLDRAAFNVKRNPAFVCITESDPNDSTAAACDDDRYDLRDGKRFFSREAGGVFGQSIDTLIADAFRYKVKFRSRSGSGIGFTPAICIPNSNAIPYCYSPSDIEEIEQRATCAAHIYTNYSDALFLRAGINTKAMLRNYLVRNFAYEEVYDENNIRQTYQGFETLYAELLIMLGDESYTQAFQSRFDLAGQDLATFNGSRFEVNGINLTGGAGFEMVSLYKSAQYYQKVLDRFYAMSPMIGDAFENLNNGQGFITPESVGSYFQKLIKASSQKARVWSQISKKYQRVNEPELARQVIERAYVSAYLEGIILAQLMLRTIEMPNSEYQAGIESAVNQAQLTYQAALMDMLNLHKDISNQVTFFGIPPDYIPFPALYDLDINGFTKLRAITLQKMSIAQQKEERALADNRSFETDSASFQSELFNIAKQYEDQLAQICGTFSGDDGQIYPAIKKYAEYSDVTRKMGDPCGAVGNGAIYDAIMGISLNDKDHAILRQRLDNLTSEMDDALAKTDAQCNRIEKSKNVRLKYERETSDWNHEIGALRTAASAIDRTLQTAQTLAAVSKCSIIVGVASGGSCPAAAVASGIFIAAAGIANGLGIAAESRQVVVQRKIDGIQQSIIELDYDDQCSAMRIDTQFVLKDLFRRQAELEIELQKMALSLQMAGSGLQKLVNDSKRLQAQQSESEQLNIDVQAARNDPNVRIYRNDAVIAADRTFYSALVEAYRLTKVYEYYTSQSYPDIIKLQLSRMISYGDFSLEEYVADLEQAYYTFEETYGVPDLRQEIISLKKDIFNITEMNSSGTGASGVDMTNALANRLTDPNLLNDKGYIVIPFSTKLSRLSPLTRNHKIKYIEVNVLGAGAGDRLGRIYVRQTGTGVVSSVDDDKRFYVLPERTAVVNYSSKGDKPNEPDYYKNERLRDRPLVNTSWELVINTKDEAVNEDMDLTRLTDIKLFIYYNDFTVY